MPTTCPYCAMQCEIFLDLSASGEPAGVRPRRVPGYSRPLMCAKGFGSHHEVRHPDRLAQPLVRDRRGDSLRPASWDEALARVRHGLQRIGGRWGREAVAVFGGGSLTNEAAYLLGKFSRLVLGTPNFDYNGRFCMAAAARGARAAFGLDRGLSFPLSEIASADHILLVGSNPGETLPPLLGQLHAARRAGAVLTVVDPRATGTVRKADHHLAIRPGGDLPLLLAMASVVLREGLVRREFVDRWTDGFAAVAAALAEVDLSRAAEAAGLPAAAIAEEARRFATARAGVLLTGRGAEQHATGSDTVSAAINLCLMTGQRYGALTGQGNGQGGREHGQKSDQLPGYRSATDPHDRAVVASRWGVSPGDLGHVGLTAFEILAAAAGGDVRGLLVMASNPAVSAPHTSLVEAGLERLEFLCVADFFLSETARRADVVLPAAGWAEQDGTVTNIEGRVVLRRAAVPPVGLARPDWRLICDLAAALGQPQGFRFGSAEAVFAELAAVSAGGPADYSGMSYARLEAEGGLYWPCPSPDHPGTPHPFAHGYARPGGRARFVPVGVRPPAERPDEEYPLLLTTGRLSSHYQSGNQTRRLARSVAAAPEPLAQMHPATAARAGLAGGDLCRLRSRRGAAVFRVRVDGRTREDVIFVPFHWGGERAVNRLCLPALDPAAFIPSLKLAAVALEPADRVCRRPAAHAGAVTNREVAQ